MTTPQRPPGIIVCGMPRSSTTWIFNIISAWLTDDGQWKHVWINEGDSAAEQGFCQRTSPTLGKCHHFSEELAQQSDLVIYSLRDVRTAAVSCRRKFGDCSAETVSAWIRHGESWRKHSHVLVRYEDVAQDALRQAEHLRGVLIKHVGKAMVRDLSAASVLKAVDERFTQRQHATGTSYDPSTLILAGHRTFQPPPDQLDPAERALYESIGSVHGEWLHANGYQDHQLGQDLDYRIAALAMSCCGKSPVVVDVGAERGSFIDLALAHGAGAVHAFEPLPRHIGELSRRFAGHPQVFIHAAAASDREGTAEFHIATDRDGKELDYYHTLSGEVGDSTDVIRTARTIPVKITSLAAATTAGEVPNQIGFLKIDTDGHDLSVLLGLGKLAPSVIMAEFWEDLPKTSGRNPYTLADLVAWGRAHGYERHVVIRRNGLLQTIAVDECWASAGDWGNILFFQDEPWQRFLNEHLDGVSRDTLTAIRSLIDRLKGECEQKESVIQSMRTQAVAVQQEISVIRAAAEERGALIEQLDAALKSAQSHIQQLHQENSSSIQERIPLLEELEGLRSTYSQIDGVARERLTTLQRLEVDLRESNHQRGVQEAQILHHQAELARLETALQTAKSAIDPQEWALLKAELAVREQLIQRLDKDLRQAIDERLAQEARIAALETTTAEAIAARNRAEAAGDEKLYRQTQAELDARALLIERLDRQLAAASEARVSTASRCATLEAEALGLQRLLVEEKQKAAKVDPLTEHVTRLESVAQERKSLIDQLASSTRELVERAVLAEETRDQLRLELDHLAMELASETSLVTSLQEQLQQVHAIAAERDRLVTELDIACKHALARANASEEAQRHLQAQISVLYESTSDLSAQCAAATSRADDLERIAHERGLLIERLDGLGRASSNRADTLEELARTQANALTEWQARALAAEQQLTELSAGAMETAARACSAEQERDARQGVIDELVRARNALAAALAAKPQPTFLGRLLFRKPT